jgi:hypothetical protein
VLNKSCIGEKMKKMKKIIIIMVLTTSFSSFADSPSQNWSGSYDFPSAATSSTRMIQADLIEKKDGGYYDSFGPGNAYVTNSIGTITNNTNNIEGDDNVVVNDSTATNSGNIDGSIKLLTGSTIKSNDTVNTTITNGNRIDD